MSLVYLPENLELEALLLEVPPRFRCHPDDFKYILGTLFRLKARDKDKHDEALTPLNAAKMQNRIRDYNKCLKYLVENGILITDNRYIVGKKSRSYGYAPAYVNSKYSFHSLVKPALAKPSPLKVLRSKWVCKNYSYLTKWLNPSLEINYDAAIECLRKLQEEDENTFEVEAEHYAELGRLRSTSIERYNLRKYNLDLFAEGVFDPKVDTTVKRFYSTLTSLKSELRNCISYEGAPLCSVDVRNSQPFISTVLFKPDFYTNKNKGINLFSLSKALYSNILPDIPSILSILTNYSSIMLVKYDESQAQSDLELYCTLVDKGRLYQYISQQYEKKSGIKLDPGIPAEKRKLKDSVFTTLFSDNRFFGQAEAEMKRFFAELFPTVYEVFRLIKKHGNEQLPIILQLIESEVMLRQAAKSIGQQDKYLPIFTIHDSIATIADASEFVRGRIKYHFQEAIGLMPNLSVETWQT